VKLFSALISVLLLLPVDRALASETKTMRWSAAHGWGNVRVMEIVRNFGTTLEKKSKNEVRFKLEEFKENDRDAHAEALGKVFRGESEAAQVSLAALERFAPEVAVISMPFLFRDFDHSSKVLDGAVGKELLSRVYEGSNGKVRALAFTYSGGIRHFYGTKAVVRAEDLAEARMAEPIYSMGLELADRVNASFVAAPLFSKRMVVNAFRASQIDLMEDDYNRIEATVRVAGRRGPPFSVISETGHSLFATAIIVNEKFFQSLSASQQELLKEEAVKMALLERETSINQAVESREKLAAMPGIKIVKMADSERRRLAEAAASVFRKYNDSLGSLVKRIRAVK
jgi:TRAP-type transport system periplasmic protein